MIQRGIYTRSRQSESVQCCDFFRAMCTYPDMDHAPNKAQPPAWYGFKDELTKDGHPKLKMMRTYRVRTVRTDRMHGRASWVDANLKSIDNVDV
jgi:hypothetical protein